MAGFESGLHGEQVTVAIDRAAARYDRLVLVAPPSAAAAALRAAAAVTGAPVINVNLEVARRLLDRSAQERRLAFPGVLEDVFGRHEIVLAEHIEILFDAAAVPLRDDACALLPGRSGRDRLPLHWGLCLAGYPFFRDVAAAAGRLLALQRTASLARIVRRVTETRGARTTVTRAAQRIVRSFVDWGVLEETDARGVFAPAPRMVVRDGEIGPWLVEAALAGAGRGAVPLGDLLRGPACFPFDLQVSARDVARRPRLELVREGREDVVRLAGS